MGDCTERGARTFQLCQTTVLLATIYIRRLLANRGPTDATCSNAPSTFNRECFIVGATTLLLAHKFIDGTPRSHHSPSSGVNDE